MMRHRSCCTRLLPVVKIQLSVLAARAMTFRKYFSPPLVARERIVRPLESLEPVINDETLPELTPELFAEL
jgi:hypothetical protein